jgi:dTDP-4-amino-4,6-dideoxygalactose transaminase
MKKIPMVDLNAQYKLIKKDIDLAIKSVIADTAFIGGAYLEKFESEMADYCGTKYAIGLNSGTDALYLSLWALGIGKGDEVITTPFTFFATAEVIARLGAKPVFVDIEPDTFNINTALIEEKITKKTKAIIPVHLFGKPVEMDKILKLAKQYNLLVVEDACQAIGALYNNKKAGSIGDVGCFSFFPSKNLNAYGDAGMIVTNNKKIAEKVKMLRNHGSKVKYYNDEIGVSSRLDGLQAAILSAKLKYLNEWNKKRKAVADEYNKILSKIEGIEVPKYELGEGLSHVYHQYTIKVKNGKRDELKKYLEDNGISAMIYYPLLLPFMEAFEYLHIKKGFLPIAEMLGKEVLSLPIYAEMGRENVSHIGEKIKKWCLHIKV